MTNRKSVRGAALAALSLALCMSASTPVLAQSAAAKGFASPPDDARTMVRWWWFGNAVTEKGIAREIGAMKEGGFGGFEIQPVYPMALDDPSTGFRNLEYLSEDFDKVVRFAADEGKRQGMRVDMTLGSGWPYGGPHIRITEASAQIRLVRIFVPAGATEAQMPNIGAGEAFLSTFIADGGAAPVAAGGFGGGGGGGGGGAAGAAARAAAAAPATRANPAGGAAPAPEAPLDAASIKQIPFDAKAPRIAVGASTGPRTLLVLMLSRTGQQLKRPGLGGEGYVLDHMSASAVQRHLAMVGEPLLKALGPNKPYAVFSDSLEVYGADWTDDMPAEFKKRRGYDIVPLLPSLFIETPNSAAVRYDWGQTLTELMEERYLTPITDWAKKNGTRFRSQTYGLPPVTLSSQRLVSLAEGEGNTWRTFSSTRWATSANHLYGNPITSSETWTWLNSPAFRATPMDMKAEADVMLLQGINQFIAHGWPYTPEGFPEPGWAFYAAAVFDDHNPWWPVMADVNKYLNRMQGLMRQGEPVADVAILIPTDDALAEMRPGRASINDEMRRLLPQGLTEAVLDAGYSFDFIDAAAMSAPGFKHKVVIIPSQEHLDPVNYRKVVDFAQKGGTVIAVGDLPTHGGGMQNAEAEAAEVKAINASLFADGGKNKKTDIAGVAAAVKGAVAPDLTGAPTGVGFVHRKLTDGDLYFVANTTNMPVAAKLGFRDQNAKAQQWDARTGEARVFKPGDEVKLAPYESRLFVFGAAANAPVAKAKVASKAAPLDLGSGWTVKIGDVTKTSVSAGTSWADDPATKYFSGEASYTRTVNVTAAQIAAGLTTLTFGEGKPQTGARGGRFRAQIDSPVRDAAVVIVNGRRVGSVWTAPFDIDLSGALKPGENTIEIRVSNTAINMMSGRALPDYRLLNIRYGERFTPQDTANLQPLPSGLLGKVVLKGAE